MGIEQSFERIAISMEKLAAILEELLEISRWNKARLEEKAANAPAEVEKSGVGSPEPEAPTMDYDTLKAELKARGISFPKGTKMTTLQKLWAKHQDAPYVIDMNPGAEPVASEAPAEASVEVPATGAAPADDLFERAQDLLRNNIMHPYPIAEIARVLGIDSSTLYRMFMRHLQISPGEYVRRFRIQKAKHLLKSTRYPIHLVASETGFRTAAAFCAEFRRRTRTTPLAYRKSPDA